LADGAAPDRDPGVLDIVALHGFTQRGASFEELEWFLEVPLEAPDLPGHGGEPVSAWEEAVDRVAALAASRPRPPILLGYSMGGRIALGAALRHPQAVAGLVLVSATPGIADPQQRGRRRHDDLALADHIEEAGAEAFVDEWLARPMFSGLQRRGAAWREADRERRLTNRAPGLAGALRSLGQGMQPDLRPGLAGMELPVLVVAGEEDDRYRRIGDEMAALVPDASTAVVRDAGHAVVGERPEVVAEAILAWASE
jgi:2-succinyl-6-hydroxy-2,4-cyclohexadiene-1-carboxylate synthase